MAQKIFVAVENSSLFDIALNTYGSVDYIGKLLADNPANGLNLYPNAGTQFVWDDSLQISQTNAIIGGSGMFVGQKFATRPTDEPLANFAPVNILPPTLAGAFSVGSTLTCVPGAWSGLPTPTTSFQWQSSTDGGATWGDISGEINSTYVIQPTDDGKLIRCNQIAVNPLGTAERASAFVAPYSASTSSVPPSNATAPTIVVCGGGSPIVGTYLVASIGTWLGDSPIQYTYTWKRGTTTVGTSIFYQLQSADYGQVITCIVTATNAYGTDTATTTGITGLSIPTLSVAPVVSGASTAVGSVLSTTNGTWTGNATITYAYQWLRNGATISGALSSSYTLVLADMGQDVSCRVTATNSYGVASSVGNSITATKIPTILNSINPVPYGLNSVGSLVSLFDGTWSEFPSSTKTYNWQFSTNGGSTWSNYSPAQTSPAYTIVSGDAGRLLRCQVTATNSEGATTANSESFSVPSAGTQRPENTVLPAITGNPYIGQVLTCNQGTWANSPTSYAYQWLRNGVAIAGASGSIISPATTTTYTLVSADVNTLISCRITATNAGGNEPATSDTIYAYDADFYAVINFAVAQGYTLPSVIWRQRYSQMVAEIKANSMWSIMDRVFVFRNAGSSNFALINWKNPTVGTLLVLNNTPTYSDSLGFTGGGTAYLDTQFNPSTAGGNYTQNNAGRYCFVTARPAEGTTYQIDGNSVLNDNGMAIAVTNTGNRINQGTTAGASTNTRTIGFHCITRTGASVSMRANDIITAQNITSATMTNANQWILRSSSTYSAISVGFYSIGSAIADADIATFREILRRYMNM